MQITHHNPLRRWQPGIRLQLTLCYTIVFAVLFFVAGVFLYTHMQSSLVDSLDTELHLRAQQVADDIIDDHDTLKLRDATSELPGIDPEDSYQLSKPADVNFGSLVRVLDGHGKVFRVTSTFHALNVPPESISQPMHGLPWQGTVSTSNGQTVRLYSRAMTDENNIIAIIQVGVSLTQLHTALDNITLELLIIGPFVLLFSAVGSYWLSSRAFKPIDRLTRTTQRIKDGDLKQRVPIPHTHDEVERLALTLNEMIDSLDRALTLQRRFVSDASHELRTPVAAIRSMIDVALFEPMEQDKYTAVLRTVNAEAERLGHLVSDLLALARADEGQAHLEKEEVRLDVLIDAVAANAEPLASEKNITLHVEADKPVTALGDEARLIQMTMNLLDNAITYTPAGGSVTLSTTVENGRARLRMQDTGIGIAAEHLPHIFERFYRVDPAHARTERNNNGLGLSIAEWVVRAHNGSITVESQPGKGSTFTVLLPLTTEKATEEPAAASPLTSMVR
jgi:two-component system OmpR family sensor kinase